MASCGKMLVQRTCILLRNQSRCAAHLQTINRNYANGPESIWSRFTHRKVEPHKEAHGAALTKKNVVYEMQVHNIKPDRMADYIKLSDVHLRRVHDQEDYPCKLFGSWSTAFGHQDQAVHIWYYEEGYNAVKQMSEYLWEDKDYLDYKKQRAEMMIERTNSLLLPFAFWGDPPTRDPGNLYELRSYHLRPGTLIEWANNWAKGIEARRGGNENVAGFFTQIGDLYLVHHLWAYKDLEERKTIREAAWRQPGWDECVAYTVPLVRKMESRIMIPLPCSPMK